MCDLRRAGLSWVALGLAMNGYRRRLYIYGWVLICLEKRKGLHPWYAMDVGL